MANMQQKNDIERYRVLLLSILCNMKHTKKVKWTDSVKIRAQKIERTEINQQFTVVYLDYFDKNIF